MPEFVLDSRAVNPVGSAKLEITEALDVLKENTLKPLLMVHAYGHSYREAVEQTGITKAPSRVVFTVQSSRWKVHDMDYEIDFEMPVVHSGHWIEIFEGTVSIKTFGGLWWIVDGYLRDQEPTSCSSSTGTPRCSGPSRATIIFHETEQINKLIQAVAA